MRKLFRSLLVAATLALAACATTNAPGPKAQVELAYDTVSAYVEIAHQSLARGRITKAQAQKVAVNATKALTTIDAARSALALCQAAPPVAASAPAPLPCTSYLALMQALQPNLLELERELRAKEAAK